MIIARSGEIRTHTSLDQFNVDSRTACFPLSVNCATLLTLNALRPMVDYHPKAARSRDKLEMETTRSGLRYDKEHEFDAVNNDSLSSLCLLLLLRTKVILSFSQT
jgi:hypothetical protein